MNNENWLPVKGFEETYKVSDLAHVLSVRSGKLLRPSNTRDYPKIVLCTNGRKKTYTLHRIVAEHFVPQVEDATVVRHKDDDPLNNKATNLEWGTLSDNSRDMHRNRKNKPTLGMMCIRCGHPQPMPTGNFTLKIFPSN